MSLPPALVRRFRERFAAEPIGFRAPGRVNLMGEHTDYNGGFVLPVAISFFTHALVAPRADRVLRIDSTHFNETVDRPLDASQAPTGHWSDYVWGVARALGDRGLDVGGANILVHGEVPLGAGLSSSASLEVAVARALLALAGASLAPADIAAVGQHAENAYVGMRCGIMDQFAATCGRAGHALLLDCRSLEYETVPLEATRGAYRVVVCNSMVHHQHAGGEYNRRREQCERGVASLATLSPGIASLRDATAELLLAASDRMDPVVARRCRHIVTENARVGALARALRAGDLARAGALMAASHRSMRDDYEISCPELDLLVSLATAQPGVFASRMTGGGFGGCTVNLVAPDAVEPFSATMRGRYAEATGREMQIHVCEAADGAVHLGEERP
jgi:galactokinase